MRAVTAVAQGKVVVQDVPEPVLGLYDCLVEVLVCGVCSGTDRNLVHSHPYHEVVYPIVLGHEGIGRVIAIGEKVRNISVGDMVTRVINDFSDESGFVSKWGAMAERARVVDWEAMRDDGVAESEWKKYAIHRVISSDIDPVAAVMFITWRETYAFFSQMNWRTGDGVLVIGSGANALAFCEHAKNMGVHASVIGSEKRKASFGEVMYKDYVSYSDDEALEQYLEKHKGRFRGIIDTIGRADFTHNCMSLLSSGGFLGVYGLEGFREYVISPPAHVSHFTYYSGEHYDEGLAHDYIAQQLQAGLLNPWMYVSQDHVYSIDQAERALQAGWNGEVMKSVIRFHG